MHPSPGLGHQEEGEEHPHRDSNPKLGRRIKAAASSFATKLHIPGTGHPSTATPTAPTSPAVEHHHVTAHHVTPESGAQQPQWQVQQPRKELQQQQHLEMPPSPATPLRAKEITPPAHEPPLLSTHAAVSSPIIQKEPSFQAETQAEKPSTPPTAGLVQQVQSPKKEEVTGDTLHQDAGSPTITTPFSGVESPQRLSSDTDELRTHHINAVPSLDRSTESQEVYVEDLETLVEKKTRASGGVGGVGGQGDGGKSAAEKLKYAKPVMQPPLIEEEEEEKKEEEEEEEEEKHTHAGPSPLYSSGRLKEAEGEKPMAGAAAVTAATAAAPVFTPTKEEDKEKEQERIEEEIYAVIEAEEQLEKEEEEEDQAIAATRHKVELQEEEEARAGGSKGKVMTPPLESSSGKIVIPALEVPDTIAVPRRVDTGRAFLQSIQTWVFANPILLFLLIAGTASLARAAWVTFSSTSSTFKDFGPLLLLSGAVALVATGLARYTMTGGTSILPLPERGMAEADVPDTTSTTGVDIGGETFDNPPPREQPGPSEPVSKESTEDLVHHQHPRSVAGVKEEEEEGMLERVEHAVGGAAAAAKEGVLGAIDPGQEMVGEVIQETDTGEKVLLPDTESPLHRAEDAVAHAAAKVKNVVLGRQSETAPPPGGGGGGGAGSTDPAVQKSGVEGYSSDSVVPGPVIEGVHPAKDGGHVVAS